jgi:S-(hydroxymethyl)glutathione dehydrogenase/alcohol dehydrogenase
VAAVVQREATLTPRRVKAAVCREFGEPLMIEEIEIAAAGRSELEIELAACAICQSDIHYLEGAWGGTLPAVYGHEAAGVVAAVGAGVEGFEAGDHVVVTLIRSCGACDSCARDEPVLCDATFPLDERGPLRALDGTAIVQGLRTGAFAERVVVDASQAVVIPVDIPLDCAALLACGVITGFGAVVNTAQVEPGSSVVVIGTGGVGLNAVQGAVFAGATTVVAVDPSDVKLEAARAFGATHTVNPDLDDVVEAVPALTGGRGADYVIVAVGVGRAIEQGPRLLRRAGTMVIVGMPASGVTASIDPATIANEEKRIVGSKMGSARIAVDVPNLVGLYREGRLKLDELITGRYPLEQINEAIASVSSGKAIRNLIVF